MQPWGSFKGWSEIVRNTLVWAGLADPGSGRQELASQSDSDALALRSLLVGLSELDPDGHGTKSGEILRELENHPDDFHTLRDALGQAGC